MGIEVASFMGYPLANFNSRCTNQRTNCAEEQR